MSEQLPIKAATSPVPASNKVSSAAPVDNVTIGKRRGFRNVLSDQFQHQETGKTHRDINGNSPALGEDVLPLDGKTLPVSAELLEFSTEESGVDAELATAEESVLDPELVPEGDELTALVVPVIAVDSKSVGAASLHVNGDKPAVSAVPATQTEVVARLSLTSIAGEASDDTAQAQAVSNLRQIESLEGNVTSLTARGEADKTLFQTSKIIEQFTDIAARPTTASVNNLSAPVSVVSPVNTTTSTTSTATGLQQVSIDVPVQHQQWQRAFAERVVWSVGNSQSVQVRINPAELGPIDIQLNVTKEQTNITFNTTHAMTRDTIELALPKLRDMLANEGLNLGDVDVRHQDSSAQGHHTSQDQDAGTGRNSGFGNQDPLAEDQSELMLLPVMISENAVDFYI